MPGGSLTRLPTQYFGQLTFIFCSFVDVLGRGIDCMGQSETTGSYSGQDSA